MKDRIQKHLQGASTLQQIASGLTNLFLEMRHEGVREIGYVSGMITSEGPENIDRNLERLDVYTSQLQKKYPFPIFSQNDIFTPDVYEAIKQSGATHEDFDKFYRDVHGSGYITHMFMTPKWELSLGANEEYHTAKKNNLNIVFVD
jgi:hypothetical protein